MKALHAKYRAYKGAAFDPAANYVFVMDKACNEDIAGDMPRRSQFGYVFTGTAGSEAYRVLAHELGHGKFTLHHTFDGVYANIKDVDNLMNYAPHQNDSLAKWQWDILHDPAWLVAFDSDEDAMASWTIIDEKHTKLLKHVYNKNLESYNKTETSAYKTNEWTTSWTYGNDKSDIVIKALKKAANGQTVDEITLHSHGIYIDKHTVGNVEYATAIYSRKETITKLKKVVVSDLKELQNTGIINKSLYCESSYSNYLVLAFYEEGENEPSLIIQASKQGIDVFTDTHLKAWMDYLGLLTEDITFNVNGIGFIHQFDNAVSSLNCHWCSSALNPCCDGGVDRVKNDATGVLECENGTYKYNNCCYQTSRYMITNYGKPVGNKINLNDFFVLLVNSDDCRDGVTSNTTIAGNETIQKAKEKLKQQTPLLAGVFYEQNVRKENVVTPQNRSLDLQNSASNHFIVIVGYDVDEDGREYFIFYDPASSSGNNKENKLYFDNTLNLIKGKRAGDNEKSYILTEIRIP
jgi:hypothetical protein